ncbi:Ig-like domain-containing protein [Pantoea vagans]|uniref:Ig-like domain-containing protein n=1 Tax=Pantoea vagans TaxID=470934 RepID=UPI0023AF4A5A|nr:Ig-like domain-containing protein [Pantoea vagans]MDE8556863.1 Ig-like domain-containing protein [Pantoea vagans]MDE8576869.1 Ig-like domain-containing protein [Pantoea vagans]
MSTRDTLRSVRFESIFQTAVSDFAVTDSALPAITPVATQSLNLPVTPLSAESPHSSPLNYSALAVSTVESSPPAALRPYEPIARDGVIAAWEAQKPVHLRGRAEGEAGSTVTLTFNDQSWHSTVNKWDYWNASMPADALKGVPDGNHSLALTITDKAGHSTTTDVDFGLYVDRTIKPTLTVDTVSGDNAVNIAESIYGVEISGSATHLPAGSLLKLTLGTQTTTAHMESDGKWYGTFQESDMQALRDGVYSLTVTATDPNGKIATDYHDLTLITHLSSLPKITFDKVTSDDVINLAETQQDLLLSGALSTVMPGHRLVITGANQKDYAATIGEDGHWQVVIPAAEVNVFINLGEIRAWSIDGANNYTDATHELNIHTGFIPIYTEMDLGDDMTLNYQEAQHDLSFYVEGCNTLEINGKTHQPDAQGMVTLTSGELMALPDGPVAATFHRQDQYGNSDTQNWNSLFTVAVHQRPTLTLDTAFDDNKIDAADVNSWHLIQGSSSHLQPGSLVELTLGDQHYSASVKADGGWALTILAGQLAPLDDGEYQMTVSGKDSAGNLATASQTVQVVSHTETASLMADQTADNLLETVTLTRQGETAHVAPTSTASAVPQESHLFSDVSYTLADHLLMHPAAQPIV